MKRQSLVIWLFIVYIMLLTVAAWIGSPAVTIVFLGLLAAQAVVHAIWICPTCGNYGCAINPRSPYFFLGARKQDEPLEERQAKNTTVPIILLAVTILIALYAVWLASPMAMAVMLLSLMILYYIYANDACRGCPNKCPMASKPRESEA